MKIYKRIKVVMAGLLVVLGILFPSMCVKAEEASSDDIATLITNDERFHTASTLLKAAGLVDVLEGEGPYTVFVPSDDAFKALPAGVFTDLIRFENKEKLEDLLAYHICAGGFSKEKLANMEGKEVTMLNNKKVMVNAKGESLLVNKAKIRVFDIPASNGVIHVIDMVLVPKG